MHSWGALRNRGVAMINEAQNICASMTLILIREEEREVCSSVNFKKLELTVGKFTTASANYT
jgi:hypothetical protein